MENDKTGVASVTGPATKSRGNDVLYVLECLPKENILYTVRLTQQNYQYTTKQMIAIV